MYDIKDYKCCTERSDIDKKKGILKVKELLIRGGRSKNEINMNIRKEASNTEFKEKINTEN